MEKVLKGLECCSNPEGSCMKCPYTRDIKPRELCMGVMAADALKLIREQNKRIWDLCTEIERLNDRLREVKQDGKSSEGP